ncbi:KTSC domain-containing protein [Hufsiella ginkgonis]|uniref:KTSC domain-containing protein n=1 Tax=Hufsiella ginkgonis TaxID=2695274 RepID=A0A7K1Y1G3_9SPHI|nr:KTSC domain-containing protein [Hufsiella ginkgonis]MXV16859.1 KTSC domain-containing protein [Hufsiella ginkgonis]
MENTEIKTATINDREVIIDARVTDFKIGQKPSSNVDYFGTKMGAKQLFVQFKNGSSYIYSDVDEHKLISIHAADSVGKFFSKEIAGKFSHVKVLERLITIKPEE